MRRSAGEAVLMVATVVTAFACLAIVTPLYFAAIVLGMPIRKSWDAHASRWF